MKEEAFKFQNMKTEAKQTDFTSTCKSKFDKKNLQLPGGKWCLHSYTNAYESFNTNSDKHNSAKLLEAV